MFHYGTHETWYNGESQSTQTQVNRETQSSKVRISQKISESGFCSKEKVSQNFLKNSMEVRSQISTWTESNAAMNIKSNTLECLVSDRLQAQPLRGVAIPSTGLVLRFFSLGLFSSAFAPILVTESAFPGVCSIEPDWMLSDLKLQVEQLPFGLFSMCSYLLVYDIHWTQHQYPVVCDLMVSLSAF
jgi:hypothetical protein